MILISKKPTDARPEIYRDWLAENQTEIVQVNSDRRSPHALWELLGKTLAERETTIDPVLLRYELQLALYEEQHGICCYCGDRLRREWDANKKQWVFENQSIEHFLAKNQHKELVFEYDNLMLCCKNSIGFSKIRVSDKYNKIVVKGWDEVASLSEIPFEKIIDYRPNRHLKAKNELKSGDVIHIPNPTHCDDEKSKHDAKPNLTIINPTKDGHLIEKLTHDAEGNIGMTNANEAEIKIIEKTFEVLGLVFEKLTEKRKGIWGKTDKGEFEKKYAESFEAINTANVPNEKRKAVVRKLIDKVLEPDDSDGLLAPFCFVEHARLKHEFSMG
jgi:hypothetical protein